MLGAVGSGAPLPGFLHPVLSPLEHYGYWAIALLLFGENIGIPVLPGEFGLIAGAVLAGTGRAGLNVVVVGVIAVICCFAGAEIGYAIGRFGGRALVLRYGRYVFIREHHLDRAEAAARKYGGVLVVVSRFIVGLREFNGIIAGVSGMQGRRFALYNGLGAAVWVSVWVSAGYLAGAHIDAIYHDATRYSVYVLAAVVVALASFVSWRVRSRRRRAFAAVSVSVSEPDAGIPPGA